MAKSFCDARPAKRRRTSSEERSARERNGAKGNTVSSSDSFGVLRREVDDTARKFGRSESARNEALILEIGGLKTRLQQKEQFIEETVRKMVQDDRDHEDRQCQLERREREAQRIRNEDSKTKMGS
jgi:hypothetical protein